MTPFIFIDTATYDGSKHRTTPRSTRAKALDDTRRFDVVIEGPFDYDNGFHDQLYLKPHKLLQWASTIGRVAHYRVDGDAIRICRS